MKTKLAFLTTLTAVALTALIFAGDARAGARAATVGDLVSGLTRVAEASGPEAARRVSTDLERNLGGGRGALPLTEGVAVDLLRSIGIEAGTTTPGRIVSQGRLGALLRGAADSITSTSASPARGSSVTPSTLDDCFTRSNHGRCVECCKETGIRANACAKACFVINKPSPSEPVP